MAMTNAHTRLLGAMARAAEELALAGVVAELVAQHAKGAWRIAEALRDLLGGLLLDEVGAQRLVLTVKRVIWREEELGLLSCYLFSSTQRHNEILLKNSASVKGQHQWTIKDRFKGGRELGAARRKPADADLGPAARSSTQADDKSVFKSSK
jgi:hypothetical protein